MQFSFIVFSNMLLCGHMKMCLISFKEWLTNTCIHPKYKTIYKTNDILSKNIKLLLKLLELYVYAQHTDNVSVYGLEYSDEYI